jgi:uncharacterized protein YndB with AHSA1/START domain
MIAASDIQTRPFVIRRTFDAPRTLVWEVWTELEHLKKWFSPAGMHMGQATMDFRPGGTFHYQIKSPDGLELWGRWEFLEIVPPEKIVLLQSFSNAEGGLGRHPLSPTWPQQMLATTTFEEENGKTLLTLEWGPVNANREEIATFDAGRESMNQGWAGTFAQLDTYLEKETVSK